MQAVKIGGAIYLYSDNALPEKYKNVAVHADSVPEKPPDCECHLDIVGGELLWVSDEDRLAAQKAAKIAESKTALVEYLAAHPLIWTDGKPYAVTEEKQSLLMGNIAAYQIEVQSNPDAVVTWNASGEECVPWDINELCALAVAIKNYVKPLVSYQQSTEVAINACGTVEAVETVVVDYSAVYPDA